MSTHLFFEILIGLHIAAGAPGLVTFWIPVLVKKGGARHRFWGKTFAFAMLFAASMAILMSITTLIAPMATHPHLVSHPAFSDPALVRGVFGWMMLYLAVLTINLAWYGWRCSVNKRNHAANSEWFNISLQIILTIASLNCAIQGLRIGQPMMIGMSIVGFATVGTNLWFLLNKAPKPLDWLTEHIKAIIGTGISVYTAFFAFGAVRLLPEAALTPALWSVPLTVGLALIIYHQQKVRGRLKFGKKRAVPAAAQGRPAAASADLDGLGQ